MSDEKQDIGIVLRPCEIPSEPAGLPGRTRKPAAYFMENRVGIQLHLIIFVKRKSHFFGIGRLLSLLQNSARTRPFSENSPRYIDRIL